MLSVVMFLTIVSVSSSVLSEKSTSGDAALNFTELGFKYGHSVEEHDVVTEDGYILTLFHIPGKTKGPVLLMHGLFDSADTFIIRGNLSLIITLANKGYDVWVGNTRGNKYGRRHKYLDPDAGPKFWDFSFHEAGYYDLAALVDFVIESTGDKSIRTIGHSQGTAIHFVLLSTRPEYNKKIKGFIALAPIAFLSNLIPPVSKMAKAWPVINKFLERSGVDELAQDRSAATELTRLLCSQGLIAYDVCYVLFSSPIIGFDPVRVEPEFWEVVMGYSPTSTSRKTFVHFAQLSTEKRFAQYDYGTVRNIRVYRSLIPPNYDLSKVTTKISLIASGNDNLSRLKDVDILRTMLPIEPKYYVMEPMLWNHVDFIWANDMQDFQ
ncbi:lipase 1-like [Leguminivora glycinivorella]|uniref:lipase 1-like n=1 Tax=Leguminivora glycinivorella TaxID=1035111 RepID=UPI00200E9573|nr:lipase 1-like [Leguminivora glycinivorella]